MKKTYEPKKDVENFGFTAAIADRAEPFEPTFPYTTEDAREQALLDAQDDLKSSNAKKED